MNSRDVSLCRAQTRKKRGKSSYGDPLDSLALGLSRVASTAPRSTCHF
jgi:hypothetical protein